MAEPPLPHPQSLWYSGWESSPRPQPTTSLGTHWGLEELGPFQKNTLPRMHHLVRANQGKHGAVERGQTDPPADRPSGWAAGGAGAAGKPSQAPGEI